MADNSSPSATPNAASPRGSRKHILDWVEQPGFLAELQQMVSPVPCRIAPDALFMPTGHADRREARLDSFGPEVLPTSGDWPELRKWWLRHPKGANTPNWDLTVGCEINGRPGLILVEAKATASELSDAAKAIGWKSEKRSESGRQRSKENLEQIDAAIELANTGLRPLFPDIALSTSSHYQLSNRLAFAWKLAAGGIPVVLLYLGFTDDEAFRDFLRDDSDWRSLFYERL